MAIRVKTEMCSYIHKLLLNFVSGLKTGGQVIANKRVYFLYRGKNEKKNSSLLNQVHNSPFCLGLFITLKTGLNICNRNIFFKVKTIIRVNVFKPSNWSNQFKLRTYTVCGSWTQAFVGPQMNIDTYKVHCKKEFLTQ